MTVMIPFKCQLHPRKGDTHSPVFWVVFSLCLCLLNACVTVKNPSSRIADNTEVQPWQSTPCDDPQSIAPEISESIAVVAYQGQVCKPQVWGGARNVVRFGQLFLSEQPDAATFDLAREKGISMVINLRAPAEFDWDEQNAAKDAGLNYYNIPLIGEEHSFDPQVINQLSAVVKQHGNDPILVHCSSGNRASAWLAIYLVNEHNIDLEKAIALAKKTGLTKPAIEAKIRRYLTEHAGD